MKGQFGHEDLDWKELWSVQKSPASKATGNSRPGAYGQYVSTGDWRKRRWCLFSTDPFGKQAFFSD